MNVDFVTAIKLYFANYFNFKGRSTRAEYWWATLFVFLLAMVMSIFKLNTLSSIVSLVLIIPNCAILTRRFHDIGRSGWWVVGLWLASLLACVIGFYGIISAALTGNATFIEQAVSQNIGKFAISGIICLAITILTIIWACTPSGPDNQYGPNPYGDENE